MSLRVGPVARLIASCNRSIGIKTSTTREISSHTNSLCIGRRRFLQNESSRVLMQFKRFSQFKRHSHQTQRETQQIQRDASLSIESNILPMSEANVSASTHIERLVNSCQEREQENEVSQLWPHICVFVEQWWKDAYLNEILKEYMFSDFEFCLGKSSPSYTVKVHDRNESRPEIVVDLVVSDFCIDAAKFRLASISCSLKNIKVKSTSQLILTSNAKTSTLKVVVNGVEVDFDTNKIAESLGLKYALSHIIRFLLPYDFTVVLRNAEATYNLKSDPFALLDVLMPELESPNYCVQASETSTLSTNELLQRKNVFRSSIVPSVCISQNLLHSTGYMSSDPYAVLNSAKRKFDMERNKTGIDNIGVETENIDMCSDKITSFEKTTMAKAAFLEARGESDECLRAVAFTIKNRAQQNRSYWGGRRIADVCLQPYQFEISSRGVEDSLFDENEIRRIRREITDAIYDGTDNDDITLGSDHFLNPNLEGYPQWVTNCKRTVRIGSLQFLRAR